MAEIAQRLIGLIHGFARFAHYKSCRRLAKGQVATVAACHRRQGRGNRVWITARQRFAEIAGVTENEKKKKKGGETGQRLPTLDVAARRSQSPPLVTGPSCRYRDRRNSSTTTATTTVQLLVTIERKKTIILAKSRSGCDPV